MDKESALEKEEKENAIDLLEDSAKAKNNPAVVPRLAIALGVFGVLVMPVGAYVATAAAVPFVLSLTRKLMRAGREDEYMERTGNFAHGLSEAELIKLTRLVGKEDVVAALQDAESDDQRLSKAAQRYLDRAVPKRQPLTVDAFFSQVEESEQATLPPSADSDDNGIGQQTRLYATNVSATAVAEDGSRALSQQDVLDFIYNELTLLWGKAGSAKTTAVMAMGNYAASQGFRVLVGDPHYKLGSWPKFKVFQTHEDCDLMLQGVKVECAHRYDLRRTAGKDEDDFEPWLVILEEFTNWSKKVTDSADFIESAIQDFRKANIHVLMVSHARTLTGLGSPKGFSESFHNGCVELNLLAQSVDTAKGRKSRPTGQGRLRFQGGAEQIVQVPDFREYGAGEFPDQSNYRFDFEGQTTAVNVTSDPYPEHTEAEPEKIPGTNRTREKLKAEILRQLIDKPGKELLVKQLVRFEEGSKRQKLYRPAEQICKKLSELEPSHYIFKPAAFGCASISYQDDPLTF